MKLRNLKKMMACFVLVILIMGFISTVYAASSFTSSNPQFTSPSGVSTYSSSQASTYWSGLNNPETCGDGFNDIMVQIAPLGCSPSVVRSDLLEDQNVPVFCRLEGLRINPSIDISRISRMQISGNGTSEYVAGVGFHPARQALKSSGKLTGSPISDNMGYAVVVLRQIPSESQMPDFVSANLTAVMQYDSDNSFGIGVGEMHLPTLNENEWNANYKDYSFWRGRGYLRAESVQPNSARIAVYSERDRKVSTITLDKGETSNVVYLPGTYCRQGVKIRLSDTTYPKLRVRIAVDDDEYEVYEGGKFLDDRCTVSRIISYGGGSGEVDINCPGEGRFTLKLEMYDVELDVEGVSKSEYTVGDQFGGMTLVYSGYYNEEHFIIIKEGLASESKVSYLRKKISDSLLQLRVGSSLNELETHMNSKVESGLKVIEKGGNKEILDKTVRFSAISGVVDQKIESEPISKAYKDAEAAYKEVDRQYGTTRIKSEDRQAGEIALAELIELAKEMKNTEGKKARLKTAMDLMEDYISKYPNGEYARSYELELESMRRYNQEEANAFVEIDYEPKAFRLMKVKEPSFDEIGVIVQHGSSGNTQQGEFTVGDYIQPLSDKEYIKIIDITEETVKLEASYIEIIDNNQVTRRNTYIIRRGEEEIIGGDYVVFVNQINFKRVAEVRLTPTSSGNEQEVSFPFSVSIEKRAINLSTDQLQNLADTLNSTIASFEEWAQQLGDVIRTMKTACLITSVAFSFKLGNIFGSTSSATDARKYVMRREPDGWFSQCESSVDDGDYSTVNQCLLDNNAKIEEDVKNTEKMFSKFNNLRKTLKSELADRGKDVSIESVTAKFIRDNYGSTDYDVKGEGASSSLNTGKVLNDITDDDIKRGTVSASDIENIGFYINALNEGNTKDQSVQNGLYNLLNKVNTNKADYETLVSFANDMGVEANVISYVSEDGKKTNLAYNYLKFVRIGSNIDKDKLAGSSVDDNTPIALVLEETGDEKEPFKRYLFVLQQPGSELRKKTGIYNTLNGYEVSDKENPRKVGGMGYTFKGYSDVLYHNNYKDPKVTYHAGGIPHIMPFDRQDGWYAAITLESPGATRPITEAGEVKKFWIGNVGADGYQSFGGTGDEYMKFDINQGIQSFPGLSLSETNKLVGYAKEALRQAMLQKDKDQVTITKPRRDSFPIEKYSKSYGDYDAQCQDFMSPRQCQILFNICDPVVCPSSRCDMGGSHPVENVIQSGILGSILLCLPNIREGVFIPICLTGIHAGIQGWIEVLKSYRDCTQQQLEDGRVTGVCDELYSMYQCDFFVSQFLRFFNVGGASAFSLVRGLQGEDKEPGGGEYLDTASALQNAEEAQTYFTSKYAEDSKLAFGFKSTDYIATEVCKVFISQSYPTDLDALLDPESPPQFHAYFSERSYSEATVPATSQYKVYYHIYAGNDSSVGYTVYLTDPPESEDYEGMDQIIVDSGTVIQGQSMDETKDFTAPAGYKKLCVRINGDTRCGFGRVSTRLGTQLLTESYISEQARNPVTTESECSAGTSSLSSMLQPNLQAGVEETLQPSAYRYGIIRICATNNPGNGTEEGRWENVGHCGDENIRCWLDKNSISENIENADIEGLTIEEVERMGMENMLGEGYMTEEEGESKLEAVRKKFGDKWDTKGISKKVMEDIHKDIKTLLEGDKPLAYNYQQAEAKLLEAKAYHGYLAGLISESPQTTVVEPEDDRGVDERSVPTDVDVETLNSNFPEELLDAMFDQIEDRPLRVSLQPTDTRGYHTVEALRDGVPAFKWDEGIKDWKAYTSYPEDERNVLTSYHEFDNKNQLIDFLDGRNIDVSKYMQITTPDAGVVTLALLRQKSLVGDSGGKTFIRSQVADDYSIELLNFDEDDQQVTVKDEDGDERIYNIQLSEYGNTLEFRRPASETTGQLGDSLRVNAEDDVDVVGEYFTEILEESESIFKARIVYNVGATTNSAVIQARFLTAQMRLREAYEDQGKLGLPGIDYVEKGPTNNEIEVIGTWTPESQALAEEAANQMENP